MTFQHRLYFFWRACLRVLRSPLTWVEQRIAARRAFQLELAQVQAQATAQAITAMGTTMATIVADTLKAQTEQTKLLQTWLDGFKVTTPVGSTVVREEDEERADRERYAQEVAAAHASLEAASAVRWTPQDTVNWLDAFDRPIPR